MEIAGKRFTVLGLGILGGGVGVAKYLASHGGIVTVTDMRPAEDLQSSIDQLAGLPITYHLGGHDLADFTPENADVVIRNPGVRRSSPYLQAARESGVRIEMEMSLFFAACKAPILGITGTKGKTTVSTLCGEIVKAWKPEAILAGNMGVSALGVVDDIAEDQPVVIELSSWQLEALDEHKLGPNVAVITNISPDHLDAYDGYEDYAATKRTIAHHQAVDDYIVYNADDADTRNVADEASSRTLPFGLAEPDGDGAWIDRSGLQVRLNGAWVDHSGLQMRLNGALYSLPMPTQLALQGEHGTRNALAAVMACLAYGVPIEAIRDGLASFRGVPNRLEELGTINGVMYVNDTSATAPAAAVHAIEVLGQQGENLHIVCGGADKRTDLTPFADAIASSGVTPYLLDGSVTPTLQQMLDERNVNYHGPFANMQLAFASAQGNVRAGDVLALVPGCASFGMFRNEFDRGDQFRAEVKKLQESTIAR